MDHQRKWLEHCYTLPSAIAPHEAREIFDKAMQHVREHQPANCDAIIGEFAWADHLG